jgi:RNA polymerase sigma-70 factor (ECF subfamily)
VIAGTNDLRQDRQVTPNGTRDRELVDAVLGGNADAYRLLIERESRAVVAICSSILRDPEEASDVAQEAFLKAYRSLAGYRGDGTFGAWVGRIATRMAVQRVEATRRRGATAKLPDEVRADDAQVDPERQFMNAENATALRAAVERLPADQREVVTLRFFNDMPIEQIAAVTHAPIGTVKSRLHRALERLRSQTDLRSAS